MSTKGVIKIADNLVRFGFGLVQSGTRQRQNERQDKIRHDKKDKTKGKPEITRQNDGQETQKSTEEK